MANLIFTQLSRYLHKENPDHACMINGKWGSGKTYFLKEKLREELNKDEKLKELKIRYASANGVKDFDEIIDELKRQKIIPETSSKVKIIGKLAGRVLDNIPLGLIANVIVPGSGGLVNTATEGVKNVIKKEDLTALIKAVSFDEKDIIIIDDLERVHKDCDLIGLLGDINTEFVEHHRIKTILVCDEYELEKRFSAEDRKLSGDLPQYKAAKEKSVRYTYTFKNKLKPVITNIIQNLDPDIYTLGTIKILSKQENISSLADLIGQFKETINTKPTVTTSFNNLRVIKHIIEIIADIINITDPQKIDLVFNRLINFVVNNVLFYKYYNPNDLDSSISKRSARTEFFSNADETQKDTIDIIDKWILSKYQLLTPTDISFESKAIRAYIFNGIFQEVSIIDNINSQINAHRLDKPEGKDLGHLVFYQTLEDDEFKKLTSKILNHLKENKFTFTQCRTLVKTLRKLVNDGYSIQEFETHEKIANYFEDYLKNSKAECIRDFYTINWINAQYQEFLEPEYKNLKNLVKTILSARETEMNNMGLKEEFKMVLSGDKKFDENLLIKLIENGDEEDKENLYQLYLSSNNFKNKFAAVIDNPFEPFSKQVIDWIKNALKKALEELKPDSIGRIKVKTTFESLESESNIS